MQQTAQSESEQFREQFNGNTDHDLTIPDSHDAEDCIQSADQTMMWVPDDCPWVGTMTISDYQKSDGWVETYTTEATAVYVFDDGENGLQVMVNADKLDAVANFLGETPAEIANRVAVYRQYPILIPTDHGRILIAPMVGMDTEE
jgi:hypothetical protein